MKATKAVYNILSNTGAVTDIVADRIMPFLNPEECGKPLLVYDSDDGVDTNRTYTGEGNLNSYTIRVICMAPEYGDVLEALSDAVRDILDDAEGTFDGIKVSGIFFENDSEGETAVTPDASVVLAYIEHTYTVVVDTQE